MSCRAARVIARLWENRHRRWRQGESETSACICTFFTSGDRSVCKCLPCSRMHDVRGEKRREEGKGRGGGGGGLPRICSCYSSPTPHPLLTPSSLHHPRLCGTCRRNQSPEKLLSKKLNSASFSVCFFFLSLFISRSERM